jgi:guanylate kinase
MTTRAPRPGEVEGVDYFFVSKEEFEKRIKENKFLEYAMFVGNYYGTPKDVVEEQINLGKEVVLEIEVEGALQVREKVGRNAVFVFLVPPGKKALRERLEMRASDSVTSIEERLSKATREFELAYKYDYIVVNDEVANAADRIMAIIRAEHAKTKRSIHMYKKMIEEN